MSEADEGYDLRRRSNEAGNMTLTSKQLAKMKQELLEVPGKLIFYWPGEIIEKYLDPLFADRKELEARVTELEAALQSLLDNITTSAFDSFGPAGLGSPPLLEDWKDYWKTEAPEEFKVVEEVRAVLAKHGETP